MRMGEIFLFFWAFPAGGIASGSGFSRFRANRASLSVRVSGQVDNIPITKRSAATYSCAPLWNGSAAATIRLSV